MSHQLSDGLVSVGGDGGDLHDLLRAGDAPAHLLELGADGLDGGDDAAPDLHRVGAVRDRVEPGLGDGARQHGGRGGAVAGLLVGVVGHVLHQLGAHVLELVLELHGLGHRHAVLGDLGGAPGALDDHVAALERT